MAPRGAGERASLESRRSPPGGCRWLLLRPAAEWQLAGGSAVRLARRGLVSKRASGREKRPRRRGGEPSAREASAPARRRAPGARSAFPAPLASSLLPPLPPWPCLLPRSRAWMTEAFQTWAEQERVSELWGCGDLSISHLEATQCARSPVAPALLIMLTYSQDRQ